MNSRVGYLNAFGYGALELGDDDIDLEEDSADRGGAYGDL